MIIKGKLKNGFEYQYDDKVYHSMRFLDACREAQRPETATAFSDLVVLILGVEQREALYEYIESKGDDVTVELMGDIIQEITTAAGAGNDELKNS